MPKRKILCSSFNEEAKLVCDRDLGHPGAHGAWVVWGIDGEEEKDAEDEGQ